MDILGHGGTVPSFRSRFLGKVEQGEENENLKNTTTKNRADKERESVLRRGLYPIFGLCVMSLSVLST